MISDLTRLIEAFAGLDVLVIGDAMLDSYLEGTTGRLCREAPVPVITLTERRDVPGGAANTAVNVRSLGARVTLLSAVGDDAEGELLRRCLEARGVGTAHVLASPVRRTIVKHRILAESQMLVRFDQGSTEAIDPPSEHALLDRLGDLVPRSDAVIVSDYVYGVLTPGVIRALEDLQARSPRVVVADSRSRLAEYRRLGVSAVKPNYDEALQLLGARELGGSGARAEAIAAHGEKILEITGARIAAVTLDTEGALVFERGRPPYRTYARPERRCRAAGAGDTFVAALTLALAAGADTPAAAELASAASAIVVGKEDTASCTDRELRLYVAASDRAAADLGALAERVAAYRRQGKRIIFTNGCFDILHRGHVTYLNQAKALGDILIVGVNSDDSIRRLKGPPRPINTLDDRVQVLAALSCIDHIITFDEDTPSALLRALRPDVFVKGGDYTRPTIPEAPLVEALGGEVRILPYVEDRSTTDIIERIRLAYAGPGDGPLAPLSGVAQVGSTGGIA
ncbi:MAG: D-glycero-beta-D-manno-heptose 1-phosphate adenylyltransferase [Isosphaeraceae bacterium]|nr:D-glycero-beta-D-manno-heptose 1-phosphate adenylyltransferase [Isosphaeraceae bacterium]